jgi:hypothetical protein
MMRIGDMRYIDSQVMPGGILTHPDHGHLQQKQYFFHVVIYVKHTEPGKGFNQLVTGQHQLYHYQFITHRFS